MAIAAVVMAGLQKLPRKAIPETLEIMMRATGVDSVTLRSGLLRSVPVEIEEAQVKFRLSSVSSFELAENRRSSGSGSFHLIPLLYRSVLSIRKPFAELPFNIPCISLFLP